MNHTGKMGKFSFDTIYKSYSFKEVVSYRKRSSILESALELLKDFSYLIYKKMKLFERIVLDSIRPTQGTRELDLLITVSC